MRNSMFPLALAVLCLLIASPASARTWEVPAEVPTIQAGLDSASVGDTVLVYPGTYYETLEMKAAVYLIGQAGAPESTIVDAENLGSVVSCIGLNGLVHIEGFTFTGGAAERGGGVRCSSVVVTIADCVITGNTATSIGAGIHVLSNNPVNIRDCVITDNSGAIHGGGICCYYGDIYLDHCLIASNSCSGQGGGIYTFYSDPMLTGCVVSRNTSGNYGGGAYFSRPNILNCDSCTFYGNEGRTVSGIHIYELMIPSISNTIIAFGVDGQAIGGSGVMYPDINCCDVYGNEGGDWVGYISGHDTTGNNVWADPLFCDPDDGDFHLAGASPCIGGACGQIGALGAGCEDPLLSILAIDDVGDDQGRNARLTWRRSSYDAPMTPLDITGYEVYRRQDGRLADRPWATAGQPAVLKAIGWDYVGTVPAHGDSYYQYVAPTLCDSASAGICWSVFFIRAASTDPFVYMDSEPDSGYSIDNLAPAPPPGLIMPSATELAWDEVPDADFDYYSVYGSALDHLDETATLVGYTVDTGKDVTGQVYDYYHVTATDFSGNEGEESSVNNVFAGVPGIPDPGDIPAAFALRQSRPNPFSTTTVIAFDLAEETDARIRIYDTHGRIIMKLTDTGYEAGRHAVTWRGEDDSGNPVAPGVYFVRMEAGEFEDMKKIMLLR